MSTLKLLIEIQENRKIAEKCNKIIKNSEYMHRLKKVKEEFDMEKVIFKDKEVQIERKREKYQIITNSISYDKNELEEIKFELYNKAGSDLRLIDLLQKKIKEKQESIKSLDSESLELLEKEEELCLEKEELRLKLLKLKKNFYIYKESENKKITEAKEELKKAEINIEKMEKSIPQDILKTFNYICSIKGRGASELENGRCTGCKVNVSSMTIDNVNKEERIVYCDNCGRIIYCNEKNNS